MRNTIWYALCGVFTSDARFAFRLRLTAAITNHPVFPSWPIGHHLRGPIHSTPLSPASQPPASPRALLSGLTAGAGHPATHSGARDLLLFVGLR